MNNIDLIMKQNIRSWNEPTPNIGMGKHLICNICDIQKIDILSDLSKIADILDIICKYNGLNATQSLYNKREEDDGCTMIYLLNGYHISVHTFPNKKSLAFDLYTSCNKYDDYFILIYEFLVEAFESGIFTSSYQIMNRE
jgi:S-adenosylmethionine/arginine decarboxylase-like enzyme